MYDAEKVRALNDAFRTSFQGGRVLATPGVLALPEVAEVLACVRAFDDFTAGDDPYGEHDFGAFKQGEQQIFWKVDYYNLDLMEGSPDPADATVTTRVLTIMLAEEY